MIKNIEMGRVYFALDNTTSTYEMLNDFFLELGFDMVKDKSKDDKTFNRTTRFTNNNGLEFDVIWFRNLAHLRLGESGKAFIECDFDKIIGSYLPRIGHITLDFLANGEKTVSLAIGTSA